MDSIIGRSQFVSETANLFTDEKTAVARAKVVEWCNEFSTANASLKCELLVKVQEIVLGSCAELAEEFLEPVLSLAHDQNQEVRKQVVSFIEQICKVKVELLPYVINVISMLLRDSSAQVIKRVIQACGSIYKNGLQYLCTLTDASDSAEQAWSVLSLIKAQVLDMIDNENDGIRTNAIKFLEGIIILQSYAEEDSMKREGDFSLSDVPEQCKLIRRQKLQDEGTNIFDIMLQFHGTTHISSVNLIACTSSLCTVAKMRPVFMAAVVEAFRQLNNNLPPTLTDSQVSSVRKSLRMQLQTLLKLRGAFEFASTIRNMLLELGASANEIQKLLPKMDKQEQARRQKRILEHAAQSMAKKARLAEQDPQQQSQSREMELDEDELERQRQKSLRVNEKFLTEHFRTPEAVITLVLEFLPQLPDVAPAKFLADYVPIGQLSLPQLVTKLARQFGQQLTDLRLGPGADAFSKEKPMRPKAAQPAQAASAVLPEPVPMDTDDAATDALTEEELQRKEEATKKLRETMERAKGEQTVIERMKERAKTLKLQEITKPMSRNVKEKFLLDSVKRILNSERQCIMGGVAAKRRKLVTVIAATFPDNVRYGILEFILEDIKQRIDLAFSWLFEEYSLLQGFTRHTYVKTENRPDHAYNELLNHLIKGINERCEYKERIILLRRIYLEAPILPEETIVQLVQLCLVEEYMQHGFELVKDLIVLRPPRKNRFIRVLLNYAVHERADLRERALAQLVAIYHVHEILPARIDEFAMEWLDFVLAETPPAAIFSADFGRPSPEAAWKEDTAKICLLLALTLLPYKPELYLEKICKVFMETSAELKRTILRSLDTPIKKMGVECPQLLKLIEDCPKGMETLVIRIIYILTERVPTPHADLVKRVRDLYQNKVKDVRVLIPILSGLLRAELIAVLPKLIKLNQAVVKEVFNRLLGIGAEFAHQQMALSPTDLLVALHTIDTNVCDLKAIVKATSLCLAEREIYTQDVLMAVLQQLVEIMPVPTLMMRTTIQSLTLCPRLSNFVLNLLQRLIMKQVWRQKVIWEGFLKTVQRLKPQSLSVLLQLPPPQLADALQQCPDLRPALLEYAESIQEEPMSGITQQILDIITGKSVDVFVTDESGGYINPDNIKKEIIEPAESIGVISTVPVLTSITTSGPLPVPAVGDLNQPLPPGED
ncbi:Sym [Drosophila busckii]|uniref:Sym n=1 Tax=Drosophila busckii TaxID=30019 RepID=A0A0M4EIZ4_DROBS|nr:symplekin [Drosophila busckii]ALC46758.1 Sym [Drosophila busckii]